MDKESAEFIVNMFQFLKGKKVKHAGKSVTITDVRLENKGNNWEPVALTEQGGNPGETIIIDHHFRSELSVMLAEVEGLEYNQKNCSRLHELIQEIYREISIKPENHRVLEELKPFLGYWAPWDDKQSGETEFKKVQHLLCSDLQALV